MEPRDRALIVAQREWLHSEIIRRNVLTMDAKGVASNADKGNKASREIASLLARSLGCEARREKSAGQTSGSSFEVLVSEFVARTFPKLQHIRPGDWEIRQLGNRNALGTSDFAQYEHLEYLKTLTDENARLRTIIGNDYMVAPDVVVYRRLLSDRKSVV